MTPARRRIDAIGARLAARFLRSLGAQLLVGMKSSISPNFWTKTG